MTDATRQSPAEAVSHGLAWSCDERNRKACRNAHGCHCREITALMQARDELIRGEARTARNRDMWKAQCERQAEQLTAYHLPEGE